MSRKGAETCSRRNRQVLWFRRPKDHEKQIRTGRDIAVYVLRYNEDIVSSRPCLDETLDGQTVLRDVATRRDWIDSLDAAENIKNGQELAEVLSFTFFAIIQTSSCPDKTLDGELCREMSRPREVGLTVPTLLRTEPWCIV